MASQELNLEKKKRGRPAIGRGEQVNAMLRPEVTAALDRASSDIEGKPSRSELIRRIVVDWLTGKGYLPK
jgi:hypothetical protein